MDTADKGSETMKIVLMGAGSAMFADQMNMENRSF
jgi:hypothetical protein